MSERLTQAQLDKLVAEVEELSQRQQAELDAQQIKEILQEVNLPPELFEEAMIQLGRNKVLEVRKRRYRWLIGIISSVTTLILLFALLSHQNQQQRLARITARSDRITLAEDHGGNLSSVSRGNEGKTFYRVSLYDVPVGKKLSLSCNWINPSGQVVHQNHYKTKEITTPVWNTFCRYQMASSSPVGLWKVQMFLGDSQLSEVTFEVY